MIEELEATVTAFDARIEAVLAPFRDAAERLMSLPGISDVAAQVILAEIGTDMSSFPTAGHLLSWAGLTPRLDESAGKRRSTRLKKGAPWLKPVLVQCAFAAAQAKNTYLQAQFLRLKARRGPQRLPSRSPHRSSPPSTICCATVPSFATSDRTTLLVMTRPAQPCASCAASRTSDMMSRSKPPPDRQIRISACRVSG